jgi:nucleoside-diphosphate-sugar epimerase
VLKAAAMHGRRAPHVVLMSSIAAVGSCRNGVPIRPDTAPFPLSHYGTSKLMAECLVHEYAERVPATIVRLPSVYGPRERAVLMLFRLVKRGLALTVGSWDREVSLIYVADVVQGLLSIGGNPIAFHRTYVLAHPEAITWRGFAACVGRALRRSPILLSVPTTAARMIAVAAEGTAALRRRAAILNRGRLREMMQARWVCDPSRALVELDFQPSYPASRGVEATARWYQEAQWL